MRIAIFGASGLGREAADVCRSLGYTKIVFIVKDLQETLLWENEIILDTIENVEKLHNKGFRFIIGVGNPVIRESIFNKYPALDYPNIIHPSATFGSYQLENLSKNKGLFIAAGCRLTNSITIGNFTILNLNVTIGHDCIIEEFSSIMPGAAISGNVHIKKGAFVGCNASIIQGKLGKMVTIGEFSTVGMGSVVLRNVKGGTTVFGNPAKTFSSL